MYIIFLIKYSLSNMDLYLKFLILRWFFEGMMTNLYSSSANFQIGKDSAKDFWSTLTPD